MGRDVRPLRSRAPAGREPDHRCAMVRCGTDPVDTTRCVPAAVNRRRVGRDAKSARTDARRNPRGHIRCDHRLESPASVRRQRHRASPGAGCARATPCGPLPRFDVAGEAGSGPESPRPPPRTWRPRTRRRGAAVRAGYLARRSGVHHPFLRVANGLEPPSGPGRTRRVQSLHFPGWGRRRVHRTHARPAPQPLSRGRRTAPERYDPLYPGGEVTSSPDLPMLPPVRHGSPSRRVPDRIVQPPSVRGVPPSWM